MQLVDILYGGIETTSQANFNWTFRDNHVAHSSHWIDYIVAVLFMRKSVFGYGVVLSSPMASTDEVHAITVMGSKVIINGCKVNRPKINKLNQAAINTN